MSFSRRTLFGGGNSGAVLNGEEINNDILVSMLLGTAVMAFSAITMNKETAADSKESA